MILTVTLLNVVSQKLMEAQVRLLNLVLAPNFLIL